MIDWNSIQGSIQNVADTVKEAQANVQGFNNTIQPLLDLMGVQRANNSEEEISKGSFNEAAGRALNPTGYSFPFLGARVDILWPLLIAGGVGLYLVLGKKSGRKK